MNHRRCIWAVVLILGTMVLSGCVTAISERAEGPRFTVAAPVTSVPAQTSEAGPATATAEAPATEEPTSTPEPAPTETGAEVRQVAYEGIRFTFDPAIAAEVVGERVAPTKDPPQLREPGHLQFSLEGYVLAGTFHAPRILVYPVAGYRTANEQVARTIDELQQLLVDRPTNPDSVPFLPLFPAGQMMRAQVTYLDFQDGTGVRFLTQYAQAYLPINNHELFYTFQGLTDDGQSYVSAILPVAHPSLPANQKAYAGGDIHVLIRRFDAYIAEIEAQLGAEEASSFVPDLDALDAMIQSLEVSPQQATAPTVPEEGSEDADTPFLTVSESPIVGAAVDGPGHIEYTDRIGQEVLKRLRARADEGLLAQSNAALAPFGYRLLPRFDLQKNQTFYDLYQGEGDEALLRGLSNVWPVSVSASGSDFVLAAEQAPDAVPLLVRKDGVEEWDTEASMLLPPVYVGDALASVSCTGFPALTCQVALDGRVVYTGTAHAVGAYMPLRALTSWDDHWALEVDDHLIVDGADVGQAQGYDAAFGLALIRGRPFYFYEQDDVVHISYDGQTLPNVYDEVYHNQCCEGAIHNVAAGEDVVWFHALREGTWYFVVFGAAARMPAIPSAMPVGTSSEEWQTYSDPEHGFLIRHPVDLEITEEGSSGPCGESLHIGDQICVRITNEDPLHGRRPSAFGVVERTDTTSVAGLEATKVVGYIGSIGGYIPQRYSGYVVERNGLYYAFVLYALSFHTEIDDVTVVWPLEAEDSVLFEQIMQTLEFAG